MKSDMPDSADLLRTAAEVLKRDILPDLPEERVLDALMILSVMGAAERDLVDSGGLESRQEDRLRDLLPNGGDVRDLSRAIRDGEFDAPDHWAALHAALLADTRDRLALVNPKYLAAADKEPGTGI